MAVSGSNFGVAASVEELQSPSVRRCRVFSTIFDFIAQARVPMNVCYLFVSDLKLLNTMLPSSHGDAYIIGRGVKNTEFPELGIDRKLHLIEGGLGAFLRADAPQCGLVVLDSFFSSRRHARIITAAAKEKVASGGYLILRRYAFWLEGRQMNPFVSVLHEIVNKENLEIAGIILNGDGWPDIAVQIQTSHPVHN